MHDEAIPLCSFRSIFPQSCLHNASLTNFSGAAPHELVWPAMWVLKEQEGRSLQSIDMLCVGPLDTYTQTGPGEGIRRRTISAFLGLGQDEKMCVKFDVGNLRGQER